MTARRIFLRVQVGVSFLRGLLSSGGGNRGGATGEGQPGHLAIWSSSRVDFCRALERGAVQNRYLLKVEQLRKSAVGVNSAITQAPRELHCPQTTRGLLHLSPTKGSFQWKVAGHLCCCLADSRPRQMTRAMAILDSAKRFYLGVKIKWEPLP